MPPPVLRWGRCWCCHSCHMLAAFQQYGLQSGPLLFECSGGLLWTLRASLFIGLVVLLVINRLAVPAWARLLRVPQHYLYAGTTVIAMFCAYAISASLVDLIILIELGFLGLLMRRYAIPVAPLLTGVILRPLAETELRCVLAVSDGDAAVLVGSPLTAGIYAVLVIVMLFASLQHVRHSRAAKEQNERV